MRTNSLLYEANARLLLNRLSAAQGRPLSLATVPGDVWRGLAVQGFDLLWLMGAWRRSAAARERALAHPGLRQAYDRALPGWTEKDVEGSPYAIADYTLDPALGGPEDLTRLRENLHRAGLGLILDFVPNHLARDHRWTRDHPERFVRAEGEEAARAHPGWFFRTPEGRWLAHGRDPHFPAWDDTAQLDLRSAETREALNDELLRIAEVADGVRCDMAMLALREVFDQVWGRFPGDTGRGGPADEFWQEAIARVRARHPGFRFIAEAYWGLEARLVELGFDYTYDKTLYDRLLQGDAAGARQHLSARPGDLARRVRFIENHDEPRAATAFGRDRYHAAAATLVLPGLRLIHEGQTEGRRARLPVQLVREPEEAPDAEVRAFYDRLLAQARDPLMQSGEWSLLDVLPPAAGVGAENVLAWLWRSGQADSASAIVLANLGAVPAAGRLRFAPSPAAGAPRRFHPVLAAPADARPLEAGPAGTLSFDLGPWGAVILRSR